MPRTAILLCLLIGAAISQTTTAAGPEPAAEIMHGLLQGYLAREDLPDSLALVPPPPAPDSPAQAVDDALITHLLSLQNTIRYDLAASDNDLSFPAAAGTFSCAIGAPVNETDTPYLYQLLRRTLTDAGLASYAAKNYYDRTRPFMINKAPNCAPEREQKLLSGDPSYPSGHTSIGWAWALILTSMVPERADEILARGTAYGESRNVCNVHWPTDVIAGRTIGAATVAVLHADEGFRKDFNEAQKEVAAAKAQGLTPTRDCDAEAAALAIDIYPSDS